MGNHETCNFCSKDFVGFVTMPNGSMPLVCEAHWNEYFEEN